ncbi:MAG: response regulator [Magnetococcales bacterium]|nr:response regulator [Magnetococcales bacterium]
MELVTVENGAQAQFKTQEFDVVLMDIQMPVMDGFVATRRIREWESEAGMQQPTPIITLTAHSLKDIFDKAREVGCDDCLGKPIRKKVLLDTLAKVQSSRRYGTTV